ncbi:PREDICTED: arf-GAP with Rho-GAP domain, ANK repeat and PH domain-containing protein 2-like [Thamnophis sirtalis]|uniref:Arf-GAP with Rho-GAP domain, ANK repeat and PH domain-containing protein 2-like n=1 Tax=Thamnophis sirtalis TaxID=35019 RepID=A0A6I9Y5B7_9SAUR|nr:PREDICTED: arf-GAP with Rho-GAP domain, ANK repeat and PH domain-containing protein 2-like [Thamnophis sirtalis]
MVSFNPSKLFSDRKIKEECSKRWCVLESGFLSYYENEKMATPSGTLDIGEVICLVIHKSEDALPMGAMFTFEIYLLSERAFLFGAETAPCQRKWTQAISKHFVPEFARGLQERETDVIGQLFYKDCQDLDTWKKGWFALEKTSLYFCLELENLQENSMYLRRLQELTISSCVQNGEKTDVLLLVEKGRTLYIRGHTKLDFTVWYSAIEKAAGTNGNLLEDQQLSRNDVPIIINSCIAFVTQYDTLDDKDRVRKYSTFIRTLPPVNKATLAALMEHLYRSFMQILKSTDIILRYPTANLPPCRCSSTEDYMISVVVSQLQLANN